MRRNWRGSLQRDMRGFLRRSVCDVHTALSVAKISGYMARKADLGKALDWNNELTEGLKQFDIVMLGPSSARC